MQYRKAVREEPHIPCRGLPVWHREVFLLDPVAVIEVHVGLLRHRTRGQLKLFVRKPVHERAGIVCIALDAHPRVEIGGLLIAVIHIDLVGEWLVLVGKELPLESGGLAAEEQLPSRRHDRGDGDCWVAKLKPR